MHNKIHPSLNRRALLVALPLTALSACGRRIEPIPAADVVEHYRVVVDALIAAMDSVRKLGWHPSGVHSTETPKRCSTYSPGHWESDHWLYEKPGTGMDWEPWLEALDPVLKEHGFTKLGREKREGGHLTRSSSDIHGAVLKIYARGILEIYDAQVGDPSCN